MIVIKLREAMLAYGRKTGRKVTYEELEEMTRIPRDTLHSIGSRPGYHCSVARIEVLCRALDVTPGDMLELIDDPPKAKSASRPARRR